MKLQNQHLSVLFNRTTGRITAVVNNAVNDTFQHKISDSVFSLELGEGNNTTPIHSITPETAKLVSIIQEDNTVNIYYQYKNQFEIAVIYTLNENAHFIEKRIQIKGITNTIFNVNQIETFKWKLAKAPERAIPYYGRSPSNDEIIKFPNEGKVMPSPNSTAYYFRYEEGGFIFCT